MKNNRFSRRTLLQGAAATAGVAAFNGIPGTQLMNRAFGQAATGKSALLLVFLDGGYNAVFPAADAFRATGTFGVTGDNILRTVGNGLVVDAPTFGTLPEASLTRMASLGIRHGISDHGNAKTNLMSDGTRSRILQLAAAMGGDAAIKAAVVGTRMPSGPRPAEGAVSLQTIADMRTTIDALSGTTDPTTPDRAIAVNGLLSAEAQSMGKMSKSPVSLKSMKEGYAASVETLRKPVQPFNFNTMATAYNPAAGANPATAVNSFTQQMVAAELMIRAGANVVFAGDGGWDSHGDRTAANVRNMMNQRILPGLRTFLNRANTDPDLAQMNIVVAIMGDFSRSLPGSDHQNSLTATVIGKNVKAGTTGRPNVAANSMALASGGTSADAWAFIASALRAPTQPFGAGTPHAALLG